MTEVPPPPPPSQPAPPTAPPAPQAPVRGSGMAVTALVLGILAIIPCLGWVCGLVAIILAIVVLATKRPGKGMAIAGLIIPIVLTPLTLATLMPALGRAQELARRSQCGSNLNTIGKGMMIYMAEHEEAPPDIDTLIRQGTSEKTLKCPSAKGKRRCDYFFLFPKDEPDVGSTIVGCDFRGNHRDGRNVLTYMGSVKWIKGEAAFQAELALPHNAEFARALRAAEGP